MRTMACEGCGKVLGMNDLYEVLGRRLCQPCGEKELAEKAPGRKAEEIVEPLLDPTVCAICEKDAGNEELRTVAGAPVCEACEQGLRRRPVPGWVKAAGVVVLALACLSLARNWRFFEAYWELRQAAGAQEAGEMGRAHALLASAAERVPECRELAKAVRETAGFPKVEEAWKAAGRREFARAASLIEEAMKTLPASRELACLRDFFRALDLMDKDRSAEALAIFRRLKKDLPELPGIDMAVDSAELGAAFEGKDYDTFLAKAEAMRAGDPKNAFRIAQVASALACKYAVTGEAPFKTRAETALAEARAAAGKDDAHLPEYEERIRHRLRTREIISRREYDRRFRRGKETP
jgi:hypothetical protein